MAERHGQLEVTREGDGWKWELFSAIPNKLTSFASGHTERRRDAVHAGREAWKTLCQEADLASETNYSEPLSWDRGGDIDLHDHLANPSKDGA